MQETRVIHAADIHLGARPMRMEERERDILDAFDQLIDLVLEEKPQALLIAGDLFDTPRPDARFVKHALTSLRKVSERGIRTIAAHGEHDTPGRPQATILQVLETALSPYFTAPLGLGASNLSELVQKSVVRLPGLTVLVFPFRRGPLEARRMLASQLAEAYHKMVAQYDTPVIMLGHFSLTTVLEFDALLSPQELPPVDYVALGHVHKRQIKHPEEGAPAYAYPGSLEALNIDEAQHKFPRGPLLVDISKDGNPEIQEVKLDTRPHLFAETRISGLLGLTQALNQALQRALSQKQPGFANAKPPLVIMRVQVPPSVAARTLEAEAQRLAHRAGVLIRLLVEPLEDKKSFSKGLHVQTTADPRDILVKDLGLNPGAANLIVEIQRAVLEKDSDTILELLERLASEHPTAIEKLITRQRR